VSRASFKKDATMRSKLILIALGSALAGCNTAVPDKPDRGLAAVNVPVLSTTDYVFDVAAPGGSLAPGEAERFDGWLRSLGLGYGDAVYVDGGYSDTARNQIANVSGQYGVMVQQGAPVTAGNVQPGSVRVVVSRRTAVVPNCPNWSIISQPNYENRSMSNSGCAVNTNLAAMVANPVDLVHGREGDSAVDVSAGAKAIYMYRNWPLTGVQEGQARRPLKDVNTKKKEQ